MVYSLRGTARFCRACGWTNRFNLRIISRPRLGRSSSGMQEVGAGQATVRSCCGRTIHQAYTTVMTTLDRLIRRGLLDAPPRRAFPLYASPHAENCTGHGDREHPALLGSATLLAATLVSGGGAQHHDAQCWMSCSSWSNASAANWKTAASIAMNPACSNQGPGNEHGSKADVCPGGIALRSLFSSCYCLLRRCC